MRVGTGRCCSPPSSSIGRSPRVLDQVGQVFGDALDATGVAWGALDDAQRRDVAVQVLGQVPVLWMWDNVEPVAGFPAGTESAWSAEEQQELRGFLASCRETKARVLVTSRRDERGWLGELPARVRLPPMPMGERVQLARAVAAKQGHRLDEVEDWRPLLGYSQGNPLTVTVLVGQALRDGLRTREQVEAVRRPGCGRGSRAVADDESAGTDHGRLGASLGYGFTHAFNDAERAQLALLHLFQGFVDVDALRAMGNPDLLREPVGSGGGSDAGAGDRAVGPGRRGRPAHRLRRRLLRDPPGAALVLPAVVHRGLRAGGQPGRRPGHPRLHHRDRPTRPRTTSASTRRATGR